MLPIRAALPGDICLLLQPDETKITDFNQRQASLMQKYGGHPHPVLHFTIQRFEMDQNDIPGFIKSIEKAVHQIKPFVVFGKSLKLYYHKFWDMNLLRWIVNPSPTLDSVLILMENLIHKHYGTVHFPMDKGWQPSLVTILENPNENFPKDGIELNQPEKIFLCNKLVVSEIVSPGKFKIHGTFELGKN